MQKTSNSLGTSSDLLSAYQRHYELDDAQPELLQAIFDFDDFANFESVSKECFLLSQKCTRSFPTSSLWTNGSVGDPRQYEFSGFKFWRTRIEGFLRGYDGFTPLHIYDRPFLTRSSLSFTESDGTTVCNVSLQSGYQVDSLFEFFDGQAGPISLNTSPNVWLYITTNPSLSARFNACDKIQQAVNTDWDKIGQFQNLRFTIKDQMVDWYTGLNFYTCCESQLHVLPTFCQTETGCKNLLNLAMPTPNKCDDLFEIKGVVLCDCGRHRPIFDFVSHYKSCIGINHGLISRLRDVYYNLQFFLIDGRINVFRMCDGEVTDTDMIQDEYPDCIFHEDAVARVGAKAYNFWNPAGSLWSIKKKQVGLL